MTSRMRLARDEVHCWYVDLDVAPATEAGCRRTLRRDERRRSARFRFDRDRRRFVVAHAALRGLLGRYLGTHPGRLTFVRNASGKPALGGGRGRRLAFNLSHSSDLAVIAVAHAEVGVDVERIRALPDSAEIARCSFPAAEFERWSALPGHLRTRAFFACWTRKEAHAKARGEGLAGETPGRAAPPTDVPVGAPGSRDGAPDEASPSGPWSFYALRPAPGYVAALAVEGSGWRVTERRWRTDRVRGGTARLGPRSLAW
jgi:4'-phosphopantetheinyl transferase